MTNLEIQNAYMGSDQVDKIYLGESEVWSNVIDYTKIPLTFEVISDGDIKWQAPSAYPKTIEYRLNNGSWTQISSGPDTSINVRSGDTIQFRGDNAAYSPDNVGVRKSKFDGSAKVNVYGNIMSLIHSTGFATATTLESANTFAYFFYNWGDSGSTYGVVDAENLVLPATTLTDNCYNNLFSGCKSLEKSPKVLPAPVLATRCYGNMFSYCSQLLKAPEAICATTMANYSCVNMFNSCSSLITAPELLATTLAPYCCQSMFAGCSSLVTAPSVLPATILAEACYRDMFNGCTSLTTAPELPAQGLVRYCYFQMFVYDHNLNYVKCLARTFNDTATVDWLYNVSPTGTFVRYPNRNWSSGKSGIPNGWTIENAVL